jgi:single-stranded-DNA-specific exonuclease
MLRAIRPDADVRTYVPHRLDEGYGLNNEAINSLALAGARVIVSVDCGVTAIAPALAAKAAGVDLIITDHHNTPDDPALWPQAFAVVHPRHPGGRYPFGDLCGAGVAYKLAWRLATMACGSQRVSDSLRTLLVELLAPAALGVIADVVPLHGENRVIARFGLPRIARSSLEGLRALVAASGLDRVDAEDVGFKLGPRLNACGRMGHAAAAVELLTTASGERASSIARDLTRLNDHRRRTENAIVERACELAEQRGMTGDDRRAIVLAEPGWHAGVVGIVCSRLVERYARPVILMDLADGVAHGSGRSIDAFNLHAGLADCADLLDRFGGHDVAAGLSLRAEHLPAFIERFISMANDRLSPADLVRTFDYDTAVPLTALTPRAVAESSRLGPFGRGNPAVRVRLDGVRVVQRPESFGTGSAHLALRVEAPDRAGALRLIGWKMARLLDRVPPGAVIDAIVAPRLSTWNGSGTVEPELIDLRVR